MTQHHLLRLLDQAKPHLQPLDSHFMTTKSMAEREEYATLLAAVVTGTGSITEAQSRLFSMLLKSMSVKHNIAYYYNQAQQLNEKALTTFIKKYAGSEIAESLFFDLVVLLKISKKSTDAKNLINDFHQLLKIKNNKETSVFLNAIITNKIESLIMMTVNIPETKKIKDKYYSSEDRFIECQLKTVRYNDDSISYNTVINEDKIRLICTSYKKIKVNCVYERESALLSALKYMRNNVFYESNENNENNENKVKNVFNVNQTVTTEVSPTYYLELPKTLSAWRSLFQSALEESQK